MKNWLKYALPLGLVISGFPSTSVAQTSPPGIVLTDVCQSVRLTKRLPTTAQNLPNDIVITLNLCANEVSRELDIQYSGEVNPILGTVDSVAQCIFKEIEVIIKQEIERTKSEKLSAAKMIENMTSRISQDTQRLTSICLWGS